METTTRIFGALPDGSEVRLVTLRAGELSLSVSTLGATLTSLQAPSRLGTDDVLLGYDGFEGYADNRSYFGVTVGRFANRIGGARFTLGGREYRVSENKPGCSLHGGKLGFSRRLWREYAYTEGDAACVRLELDSPDGDQGYPGNMSAAVTYSLTGDNELRALYEGRVDAPCPVNLTNHAYFNLAGEGRGRDILGVQARLACSSYVEVDEAFLPTGRVLPVSGTPLDFTSGKTLGRDIAPLLSGPLGGYDHCLRVDGEPGTLRLAGEFSDPLTGRELRLYQTQPGLQFYTGNMMSSVRGKSGHEYRKNWGFCIEPEFFPDSPNQPSFPPAIFGPERDYSEQAVCAFRW